MFKSLKFLNEGFDRKYLKEEVEEEIFHNDNGTDYVIMERSKSGKNALLRTQNGKKWIIAWNCPQSNNGSWGQGHYFFDEHSARDLWEKDYLNENCNDSFKPMKESIVSNARNWLVDKEGKTPREAERIINSSTPEEIEEIALNYIRNNKKKAEENLDEDVKKEWKPNTSFKHIKDVYNKVKANNYKYVNNEREEMNAAVDAADKGKYTPEQRRQIKDWHKEIWAAHKKKTNEALDDRGVERYGVNGKWWYFTTHGVQPGSVPKGIQILDVKDGKNKKGTRGTFFASDRVLNTSELDRYDIKEEFPNNDNFNESFESRTEWWGQTDEDPKRFAAEYNLSIKPVTRRNDEVLYRFSGKAEDIKRAEDDGYFYSQYYESLNEDTVKQNGKWVNKGKEGIHGKFSTKKAADAQRRAMFARGYKAESLNESSRTWADEKYDELMEKGKDQWDQDDWDAYHYIMQVWGESGYFDESLNERYSFDLVDSAIEHFRNDLGRNPDVDDIIGYIERTSPDEVPEDMDKYNKWYDDIACEISARLNESLNEGSMTGYWCPKCHTKTLFPTLMVVDDKRQDGAKVLECDNCSDRFFMNKSNEIKPLPDYVHLRRFDESFEDADSSERSWQILCRLYEYCEDLDNVPEFIKNLVKDEYFTIVSESEYKDAIRKIIDWLDSTGLSVSEIVKAGNFYDKDEAISYGAKINESLTEDTDSDSRVVKTGLSGTKEKEILNSIIGQMSDGIWENSTAVEPYWMFADVDDDCNFVVKTRPIIWDNYNNKGRRNPYYQKPDYDILRYFANKLKQIVKEYAMDNELNFNQLWNKDCEEVCDYLGYDEEITTGDAFKVYQALR